MCPRAHYENIQRVVRPVGQLCPSVEPCEPLRAQARSVSAESGNRIKSECGSDRSTSERLRPLALNLQALSG
eukprot:3494797-Pyramimonas_sp.AAC.1